MLAGKRMSATAHRRKLQEFEAIWSQLDILTIPVALVEHASALATKHTLRAYDAVHLASALRAREASDSLAFACWDTELRSAAASEGLPLAPEQL